MSSRRAAARRCQVGDIVIIISYGLMTPEEAKVHVPTVIFPDENNSRLRVIQDIRNYCRNKLVTLDYNLLFEIRKTYIDICARLWIEFPAYARVRDYRSFLKSI